MRQHLNKLRDFFSQLLSPSPNAALAWQKTGQTAGDFYWLFATPVHLVLARDSFILADPASITLTDNEAEQLTQSLNQHFAQDNLQFLWHGKQWFLRLPQDPHIQTIPPQQAINRNIADFQPSGSGAIPWAKLQNEIQMLLFEHPVNQARENQQRPVVNSVWFYGGGTLAQKSST